MNDKIKSILFLVCWFFVVLAVSVGCEQSKQKGGDGYYFESATMQRSHFETNVVLVKSPEDMVRAANDRGAKVPSNREIAAFAILGKDTCTIYMLDPQVTKYDPAFIGHEFTHCVFGEWHKIQP